MDKGKYFIEDWADGFNIDEEIKNLKGYMFSLGNRDLIEELEVKLVEYRSLIELNIFYEMRLMEIREELVGIKGIVEKWRRDNRDRSMFLDSCLRCW
ncbi:MAG: hypothetical protein ACRC7N_14935 [Clostridium sp.]